MKILGGRVPSIVKEANALLLAQLQLSQERMFFPKRSREEVCVGGTWEAVKSLYSNVAADYKDADGEAPEKSNPTESLAMGKLPIIALKRGLNNSYMEAIESMIGRYDASAIAEKVTVIQRLNIDSTYMRLELDTNRALSHGVIAVNDGTNVNLDNVRVDFKIPDENKHTSKVEGDVTLDDIEAVIEAAADIQFAKALTDAPTLRKLGQAEDMRKAYAGANGISGTFDGQLTLSQINDYFKEMYGFEFEKTTTSVRVEIKGIVSSKEAWKEGVITFVPSERPIIIGHWGVVEKRAHNMFNDEDVYTDLGKYSLMSVLSQKKDPYTIQSRLETRAVPILDQSDAVHILETAKKKVGE